MLYGLAILFGCCEFWDENGEWIFKARVLLGIEVPI